MKPDKCKECGGPAGELITMVRGREIKNRVCPNCAEKLKKDGWKVGKRILL